MVDRAGETMTDRDRALLRAVLSGIGLRRIAGARGLSDEDVRAELARLLVLIRDRGKPAAVERGQPAPEV
jgi:DNA-binding CsgD family transcriptional regulator